VVSNSTTPYESGSDEWMPSCSYFSPVGGFPIVLAGCASTKLLYRINDQGRPFHSCYGSYTLCRASCSPLQPDVAIKFGPVHAIRDEMCIMNRLSHPHVVRTCTQWLLGAGKQGTM
jgi:hypothetical protein